MKNLSVWDRFILKLEEKNLCPKGRSYVKRIYNGQFLPYTWYVVIGYNTYGSQFSVSELLKKDFKIEYLYPSSSTYLFFPLDHKSID